MFEDQLLLMIGLEDDAVLVESPHPSGEFDATSQINRNRKALLPRGIEERV